MQRDSSPWNVSSGFSTQYRASGVCRSMFTRTNFFTLDLLLRKKHDNCKRIIHSHQKQRNQKALRFKIKVVKTGGNKKKRIATFRYTLYFEKKAKEYW